MCVYPRLRAFAQRARPPAVRIVCICIYAIARLKFYCAAGTPLCVLSSERARRARWPFGRPEKGPKTGISGSFPRRACGITVRLYFRTKREAAEPRSTVDTIPRTRSPVGGVTMPPVTLLLRGLCPAPRKTSLTSPSTHCTCLSFFICSFVLFLFFFC